jgi:hypothetical protein
VDKVEQPAPFIRHPGRSRRLQMVTLQRESVARRR